MVARGKWCVRIVVLVAALVGAANVYHFACLLLPWRQLQVTTSQVWINRSDLYPRWYGVKALLMQHRNPYDNQVVREIQEGFYGVSLERWPDLDQERFAYPLHVAWILGPFVLLPFLAVRILFTVLLLLCAVGMVQLGSWLAPVSRTELIAATSLFVFSWPVVYSLGLTQLSLLVAFFMLLGAAAIVRGHPVLAGAVLALATVKPQLSALLIVWLAGWALNQLRERSKLLLSLAVSMLVLLVGAEVLMPGWMEAWWRDISLYRSYTGQRFLLQYWVGNRAGLVLTAAMSVFIAVQLWKLRRVSEHSPDFAYAVALTFGFTVAVLPATAWNSYNQVLLLPAIWWLVTHARRMWSLSRSFRLILVVIACSLVWEPLLVLWLAVLGIAGSSAPVLDENIKVTPHLMYTLLPLAIVAALALYRCASENQVSPEPGREHVAAASQ